MFTEFRKDYIWKWHKSHSLFIFRRHQYTGKAKFILFDTSTAAIKKVITATEQNVIASINAKTGQIVIYPYPILNTIKKSSCKVMSILTPSLDVCFHVQIQAKRWMGIWADRNKIRHSPRWFCGSFSTRRVKAIQNGRNIFYMTASFQHL